MPEVDVPAGGEADATWGGGFDPGPPGSSHDRTSDRHLTAQGGAVRTPSTTRRADCPAMKARRPPLLSSLAVALGLLAGCTASASPSGVPRRSAPVATSTTTTTIPGSRP